MKLIYKNPVKAVLLRNLAWEINIAGNRPKEKEVSELLIQTARQELGLPELKGGATHDMIQKMRKGKKPLLTPKGTQPEPVEPEWRTDWRLLYLPSHNSVRRHSQNPVVLEQSESEYLITLRNPALPILNVFIGKPGNEPKVADQRGIYFLVLHDNLYIGETNEFFTRKRIHKSNKKILWWCFISPQSVEQTFTLDTLLAAESLLFSFWNEICKMNNAKRGSDKRPAFSYLQEAVLFTEAVSSVFLWLIKNRIGLNQVPFKKVKGLKGWPECYLQ